MKTLNTTIATVRNQHRTEFGIGFAEPKEWLRTTFVTVYHPYTDIILDHRPSVINWSAIGSQDTETAELFVDAMNQAIKLAKELNKETTK